MIEERTKGKAEGAIISIKRGAGAKKGGGAEVEVETGMRRLDIMFRKKAIGTRRKVQMISANSSLATITWRRSSTSRANHIKPRCVPIFRMETVSKGIGALSLTPRMN